MRLAKVGANLLVLLAAWCCFAPNICAQGKAAQKPPNKAQAAKTAKAAKVSNTANATKSVETVAPPAEENPEMLANRRDPFMPLVNEKKETGGGQHLPPGKAGLVIATVRVDGTVKSPNGMIAVVSNPDQRVYFVREGDRLYDGDVEKISLDGVMFRENSKDAFGQPVERMVTKRIYPSAGELQ
jgi:type IV pilus assembly protein PilP